MTCSICSKHISEHVQDFSITFLLDFSKTFQEFVRTCSGLVQNLEHAFKHIKYIYNALTKLLTSLFCLPTVCLAVCLTPCTDKNKTFLKLCFTCLDQTWGLQRFPAGYIHSCFPYNPNLQSDIAKSCREIRKFGFQKSPTNYLLRSIFNNHGFDSG